MTQSLPPLNIRRQVLLNHCGLDRLYTYDMSIGARLRQLRKSMNLSGEEFGEILGVSKGAISQWENNDVTPPTDKMVELQKRITFSLDWLYTGRYSTAEEISRKLGASERATWYRLGRSLAEPEEPKDNGTQ